MMIAMMIMAIAHPLMIPITNYSSNIYILYYSTTPCNSIPTDLNADEIWQMQWFNDAVSVFCSFFRYRPYFQVLFPALANLKDEQDMLHSGAFEAQAVAIFNVYDYVIDHLDRDLDGVMYKLEQTARYHSKIENFYGEFFQVDITSVLCPYGFIIRRYLSVCMYLRY